MSHAPSKQGFQEPRLVALGEEMALRAVQGRWEAMHGLLRRPETPTATVVALMRLEDAYPDEVNEAARVMLREQDRRCA